ncbi:band 4.1-like protein 5 [Tachysurus ichikawai]
MRSWKSNPCFSFALLSVLSLEVKAVEFISSPSSAPAEPQNEASSVEDKSEAGEAHAAPHVDNLIDFTDPTPVQVPLPLPPPPPKPIITPRWIVPAAPQTGTFTNGLLELGKSSQTTAQHSEAPSSLPHPPHTHNVIATSIVSHPPRNNHRHRGLLTTEL